MTAFASADQLASSLGVDVPTGTTLDMWNAALDDASGYLRSVIGQPITAAVTTLDVTTDSAAEADIWLVPIVSVISIIDPDGNTVSTDDWQLNGQRLSLRRPKTTYTVTLKHGYTIVPDEIVRWTKVLAAVQIKSASDGHLGLTTVSSVSVGDVHVRYQNATGGSRGTRDAMAVALPESEAQRLRATYGGMQ